MTLTLTPHTPPNHKCTHTPHNPQCTHTHTHMHTCTHNHTQMESEKTARTVIEWLSATKVSWKAWSLLEHHRAQEVQTDTVTQRVRPPVFVYHPPLRGNGETRVDLTKEDDTPTTPTATALQCSLQTLQAYEDIGDDRMMPETNGQIYWRASELWLPDRPLKVSAFQLGCLVRQLLLH